MRRGLICRRLETDELDLVSLLSSQGESSMTKSSSTTPHFCRAIAPLIF
jgi:hypothetical protein